MARDPGDRDRPSWMAVDAEPGTRPGIPRAGRPAPHPGAHGERPPQQRSGTPAQGEGVVLRTTPVYGTGQPTRGLSGVLRRAAYRLPEHRTGRWLVLLAADRLEVLGRRAAEAAWLVPAAAGILAGYALVSRGLARR